MGFASDLVHVMLLHVLLLVFNVEQVNVSEGDKFEFSRSLRSLFVVS